MLRLVKYVTFCVAAQHNGANGLEVTVLEAQDYTTASPVQPYTEEIRHA